MPIDPVTGIKWYQHLDAAAQRLEAESRGKLGVTYHRTPTNPLHTADCLTGGSMICDSRVDAACRVFAQSRKWPSDLTGNEIFFVQHRLCAAKALLDCMLTEPNEYLAQLQSLMPDLRDEPLVVKWLLVDVWPVVSEGYWEGVTKELQELLPPGELERLRNENPPLRG